MVSKGLGMCSCVMCTCHMCGCVIKRGHAHTFLICVCSYTRVHMCAWICSVSTDQVLSLLTGLCHPLVSNLTKSNQPGLPPLSDTGSFPLRGFCSCNSLHQEGPSPHPNLTHPKAELQFCHLQEVLPALTRALPGTIPGLWPP